MLLAGKEEEEEEDDDDQPQIMRIAKNIKRQRVEEDERKKELESLVSIASMLGDLLDVLKEDLKENLDSEILLDVDGKNMDKFEDSYSTFVNKVQQIESYINNYIQVGVIKCMFFDTCS